MVVDSVQPDNLIERSVRTFAAFLNVVSAIWLVAIAALILCDVMGREVFESPVYGTNEIVSNSVLSILLLQLPLSILTRNSLRTTIVYGMAGTKGRAVIDTVSYIFAGLLFLAIAIGSWPNMIEAWDILEQEGSGIISIPVYPIRTMVVFIGAVGVVISALLIWQSITDPERHDEMKGILDETGGAN